ncbi:hypothetical protein G9A89_008107 [Geosiphon pyriformis]|nr:hypothetical protein G9A89_008107 [Geosiphon pyriformis]
MFTAYFNNYSIIKFVKEIAKTNNPATLALNGVIILDVVRVFDQLWAGRLNKNALTSPEIKMADQSLSSPVSQDHWATVWKDQSDGHTGGNAFVYDGQHIGVGEYEGGLHPGYVTNQGLHIGYGGKEVILKHYKVLSANIGGSLSSTAQAQDQFKWKAFHGEVRPQNNIPLRAGYERDGKELYVARFPHPAGHGWIYGKAGRHLADGGSFGYKQSELRQNDYDVLVFEGNE